MTRLVYSVACSLDGYNSDAAGGFDWAFPSEEVVASLNDDLAEVSTFVYGRRMYETMSGWETEPEWADTREGPTLAATAFRLGLIDVVQLLICPAIVGGGTRALPDDVRLDLRLTRERRFENGMVQVTYERA